MRRLPIVLALALLAREARAQDAFEIQVYDVETAEAAHFGVENHLNYVADGVREPGAGGELPGDHVGHYTLEPHLGVTSWSELGLYLQTAVRPDGALDFAGFKVRFKARLPGRFGGERFGFALNGEFADLPSRYDASRYGAELRPIVDFRQGRVFAAVNPILSFDLTGPLAGHPQLEPCAKLAVRTVSTLALGVEYYGALGPIDAPFAASQQVHRLFAALDWEGSAGDFRVGLNAGVGYGLAAGDRVIVKAIVGIDFPR